MRIRKPIHTSRLLLRPLQADDAGPIFALFNDWEVVRYLSSPPWPYRREDAEIFVTGVIDPAAPPEAEQPLAILADDNFIGCIGHRMRPACHLQPGAGPNIGYWLGRSWWNRGYMSEAVAGLLGFMFGQAETDAVYCGAFADNAASLRVQEKAGFVKDGGTMLFSRPRGADYPHTNTVLTRARFEALRR